MIGPSKRRHSSTALAISSGRARSFASSVGMADQRAHAVADQADRGLEAGDQEPDRLREQLDAAQPVALLLGADERREDVVAEVRRAARRSAPGSRRRAPCRAARARSTTSGGRSGAASPKVACAVHSVKRRGRRPARPSSRRSASTGTGQRQVGDHVHLARAARRGRGTRRRRAGSSARSARDGARREGAAHQPAEPRVRRRVLLEHEVALARLRRLVDAGQLAVGACARRPARRAAGG